MNLTDTLSIKAPDGQPTIYITREFDAPIEKVFKAFVDPEIFAAWVGPETTTTEIIEWEATNGGRWRYLSRLGDDAYPFRGCFHEVLENERVIQTFEYEQYPGMVMLETMTFEAVGDRTRIHQSSVANSQEGRDGMVQSGMETGIRDGFAKLDELLKET